MAAEMTLEKPSALVLSIAAIAGIALWLSWGVLGIARDGPALARIGWLPAWWRLALLVLAALAIVIVLRPRVSRILPIGFAAVLLLPWLPVPIPRVFMMWSGPVVWLVWIAIGIAWLSGMDGVRWSARIQPWVLDQARAPVVAMGVALLIYAIAAMRMSPILPRGDEPHYLVIAQSLLNDGDLQIENNHRLGDYRSYYPYALAPDYLRRGENGRIYSIHAPGLPALVAPAFWLFGYTGVKALLVLIAAWGSSLVWRAAFVVTRDAAAAWFGWAAVCLTTPFVLHTFTVYPDGVGAVLTMALFAGLVEGARDRPADGRGPQPPPSRRRARWGPRARGSHAGVPWWALRGAALAALPWLHTRFALLAAVLGIALLARLWRDDHDRGPGLLAFLLPVTIGAAAWLSYFIVIYGTPNPAAPYGGYTQTAVANLSAGMPGLLFDQQFGLIANAPVYALAVLGLVALARAHPRFCIELLCLAVPYWIATAEYRMWWGGSSAPARFLVAVLLPFGIPAAMFWKSARTRATRALSLALLTASLLLCAVLVMADQGRLAYNQRNGHALWMRWASAVGDIDMGAPSFFRDAPSTAVLQATIWIASLVLTWIALRLTERRASLSRGAFALVLLCSLALSSTVALSAATAIGTGSSVPASISQTAFLQSFDPQALPHGITYEPLRVVRARDIPSMMEINAAPMDASEGSDAQVMWSDVPAGTYRLRFRPGGPILRGDVTMSVGRAGAPIRSWRLTEGAAAILDSVVAVLVRLESLTLHTDARWRNAIAYAALDPQQLPPPAQRLTDDSATDAHRYDATIVYSLGESVLFGEPGVYFEEPGFWIAGGREVVIMVAPDAPQRVQRVRVRNGAMANHITLSSGTWRQEFPLEANEAANVDIPLGPGEATVVRVRASSGFRPAEIDLKSEDRRFLGCWIEMK